MKALVFDVKADEVMELIQETQSDKEAFLGDHSLLQMEDVPDAVVQFDDWVVLQTRLCGICGSDYKIVFMDFEQVDSPLATFTTFPQVLGHEVVATVAEKGPSVTGLEVGQRVALNPWLSCAPRGITPVCAPCAEGQFSLCLNFKRGRIAPGIHTGTCRESSGGFAPRLPAHESMAIPVPDSVSDDAAVLADPFSVSLHSVLRHPPSPGDTVLVYGCGTLGLCAIEILNKLYDCQIYGITRYEHQARLAKQLGAIETIPWQPTEDIVARCAEITGAHEILAPIEGVPALPMLYGAGGIRVVYDTVGSPETLGVGIRVAGPRSTVVMSGVSTPGRYEWSPQYFKEVSVVGSNAFGFEEFEGKNQHAFRHYFDLIEQGRIDVTPILTHRFPLDDYREAFRHAHRQGDHDSVKILFDFTS